MVRKKRKRRYTSIDKNIKMSYQIQHQKNGGKCGECGDDYSKPRPRPNENGGIHGSGVIVQK